MPHFLLALAFPLAVSSQSLAVSAPTSTPSSHSSPEATTAETIQPAAPQIGRDNVGESPAKPPEAGSEKPHPWEFMIGSQEWRNGLNLGLGWAMGRHELRLLGPSTGLYVDYKATLARIKGLRFNVGGLMGAPSVFGGHLGVLYRTGGDSFWGRVAIGGDAGVSCGREHRAIDCRPAGGINFGLYFWPSDFEL